MSEKLCIPGKVSMSQMLSVAKTILFPGKVFIRFAIVLGTLCWMAVTAAAVPRGAIIDSVDARPEADRAGDYLPSASMSVAGALSGDSSFYMCLKGAIRPDQTYGGTDCWGWEDTLNGVEYAIMGVANGIAFVNTNTMTVTDLIPGPTGGCGSIRWRDIKTYKKYCYAVSECGGTNAGMMIMDMSYLPDSVKYITSFFTANDVTCHNMYIDTAKGYAYLVKSNYSGIRIVSLVNPTNPVEMGLIATGDCHDVFTRNDTAYVAEATQGSFSIWNVANKAAPTLLTRVHIPSPGYVHNVWPTASGKYVGTTEETANKTIKFWDISDLNNVALVGQYLAPSHLAHNVHMERGKAFISHYESGVAVVNMSDPSNPTELARYDTYTAAETPNFNGCWGVFPHTRSGLVYGSNLDGRLFVFQTRTAAVNDTFIISQTVGNPGQQVVVDVGVHNLDPIREMIIPLSWAGSLGLIFDSASTQGLRTSYFEEQSYAGYDPDNSRIAYRLVSSLGGAAPSLAPGTGAVLRLYLTIPANASGGPNPIVITPYVAQTTFNPTISLDCFDFQASAVNGSVTIGVPPCCQGVRGNVNFSSNNVVDLSDLSLLISYLTGQTPPSGLQCSDEANVNGAGVIDLSDLSILISYLTSTPGSVTLPSCP